MESGATCAQCARPTGGTWSEGGARWALCEDCFEGELRALERVCVCERQRFSGVRHTSIVFPCF
jgi:hypothetical protein